MTNAWGCLALPVLVIVLICFAGWRSMIRMPLKSYTGPWVPLSVEETALRDALERDVRVLAEEIGDRNVFAYPGLVRAAAWIESSLVQTGYQVRRLSYEVRGRVCENLEVEIRAGTTPEEIVVVGGHYDTVVGCGANDNGSGAAGCAGARAGVARSAAPPRERSASSRS